MLPEVGKTYIDDRGNSRHVVKVTSSYVDYHKNGRPLYNRCSLRSFVDHYMNRDKNPCAEIFLDKPLDKAFKELDKKLCSHRNIREDRYFSAMVYKTCKDCGKALN